jgi:hypothetical protein
VFYRSTCTKCRILSTAVCIAALNAVRRVPLTSPFADEVLGVARNRQKVTFYDGRRAASGWKAIAAIGLLVVEAWLKLIATVGVVAFLVVSLLG